MRRFLWFMPVAILLSAVFFMGLGMMIGVNKKPDDSHSRPVRLTFASTASNKLQTRERKHLPKIPSPVQTMPDLPSPPQATEVKTHALETHSIAITPPDISAPSQINVSQQIGNLSGVSVNLGIDKHPKITSKIAPQYPQRALRRNIQGSVTVQFIVQKNGKIEPGSVKVIHAKPKHVFERAVKQAIYGWSFQPKTHNGQTTRFSAQQTIRFSLGDH